MRRPPYTRILLLACSLSLSAPLDADDWPGFLGPQRDGNSAERGLLRSWPETGPMILWQRPVGVGYAGIAVVDGRLFTLFSDEGTEYVGAFEGSTGAEIWRTALDRHRGDSRGGGPRTTPMVADGRVFVLGASGMLAALDADSGTVRWQHDLPETLGARIPEWGVASSPLVDDGRLLVQVGGSKQRAFAAFDPTDGAVRWTAGRDLPGYASPIVATIADVRQAIFFSATKISGVAVVDGTVLWSAPWRTQYDVHAATPLFVPQNGVFISSGYDRGGALLQIGRQGNAFDVYQLWQNRVMRNQFGTSVRVGPNLYGFDESIFKCVDLLTGKERWRGRAGAKGSVVHADGLLFVLAGDGRLSLVDAKPDAFHLRADARILRDKTWAPPALANGVLYIRGNNEMAAVRVGPDRPLGPTVAEVDGAPIP